MNYLDEEKKMMYSDSPKGEEDEKFRQLLAAGWAEVAWAEAERWLGEETAQD